MYFPDLTAYVYDDRKDVRPDVLNVGWLSAAHAFPAGPVDERLMAALRELTASPVNLYRGLHLCEFCPKPPEKTLPSGLRTIDPAPGTAGNGEIHVTAADGTTYVAPVLVLHYVIAHGYAPPKAFVDAAIASVSRR